jgi:hypothetical protein
VVALGQLVGVDVKVEIDEMILDLKDKIFYVN